jgi:outer membrane protein OmpA-like peptidoglycan-associated protein
VEPAPVPVTPPPAEVARAPIPPVDAATLLLKRLEEQGFPEGIVSREERGYVLRLVVHFLPDSTRRVPGQDALLRSLANAIRADDGLAVSVTGHTALAKTEAGRRKLSRERAWLVADMLVSLGVTDPAHLSVSGFAATRPVAGNGTEAGKKLNRRVEITIPLE